MEASGSRQSRAASRYASSPSPPVFSGPVRKWKKQWVSHSTNAAKRNHTPPPPPPPPPPLLLCRWTPLSVADEPPKRRFRYAPIVPIKKGKKKGGEDEGGASLKNHGSDMVETGDLSKEEPQEASEGDQADSTKTQSLSLSEHKTE